MLRPLWLVFLISLTAQAGVVPVVPERSATERWADRCTNFTTTTWAFKAPENFLKWLDVFSDPAIWLEFARRGLEPEYTLRSADTLLDAGTPRNFLEWADPAIPQRWAAALVQPAFYGAASSTLFDPRRMLRWSLLPLDPMAWRLAGTAVSPVTWAKWLALPADPRLQALMAKAQDPMTVEEWQRELADPRNYPFMYPPQNSVAATHRE